MRESRWRQLRLITALVLGLVLAIGAPLGWWFTHRSGGEALYDSGAAAALADGASPARASVPATRTPAPSRSPSAQSGPASVPSRSPVPSSSRAEGPPTRIRIASIDVTAPVDPVGVDRHGDMAIPQDVERVGWYRWGPAPGSDRGSIVLAGHVDSAVQGVGVLFRLRQVSRGSSITLTTPSGRTWHYRVVALEEFPKTTVPLDKIFSRTGSPRLTVITCGGRFDASKRSYDDNIVVTAVPS